MNDQKSDAVSKARDAARAAIAKHYPGHVAHLDTLDDLGIEFDYHVPPEVGEDGDAAILDALCVLWLAMRGESAPGAAVALEPEPPNPGRTEA